MKSFSLPLSLSLSLSSALALTLASCESTPENPATPAPGAQAHANANAAAGQTTGGAMSLPAPGTGAAIGGWTTTASGLRYKVLSSGPAGGHSPTVSDSVTVDYRGTLTNGLVFDSSIERGEPATFRVNQVIPGWTEALQLMKPGDKWELYIPSNLAYGGQAVGDKILANSDLIFQVELLRVGGS